MREPAGAHLSDLAREAFLSLVGTAGNGLAAFGTALAFASLIGIIGVSETANSQIDARFSAQAASVVTVLDRANARTDGAQDLAFPNDTAERVRALSGTTGSLLSFRVSSEPVPVSAHPAVTDTAQSLPVFGASGRIVDPGSALQAGRTFTRFESDMGAHEVLLSAVAAKQLQISPAALPAVVRIANLRYEAVGIVDHFRGGDDLDLGIVMPTATALARFGVPAGNRSAVLRVFVEVGAAEQVAGQLALALRPDAPEAVGVVPPIVPRRLSAQVRGDLNPALVLVGAIALVIGGVGIANASMVSVLRRRREIGLRRALGARRRDVATQLLLESMSIGTVGAIAGCASGLLLVLAASVWQGWTPVVDLRVLPVALLTGVTLGAAGGLLPAWRATRVDPVDCLKGM